MCGRFTFTIRDIVDAARAFEALVAPEDAAAYPLEHRPTDSHWNIRLDHAGERRMIPARFGFARVDGQQVINARSETAGVLPTFRRAFTQSRCLVPADGFYEWRGDRGGRRPIWFHDPAEAYLARAGLALENAGSLSFVILTVPANQLIRSFHDRMPVLLSQQGAEAWLARGGADVLVPAPESWLIDREVPARVNSVANDAPELLDAAAPVGQLKLV